MDYPREVVGSVICGDDATTNDTSIHIWSSPFSSEEVSGVLGSIDQLLSTVCEYAQKLHKEEFADSQIPDKSSGHPGSIEWKSALQGSLWDGP